MSKADHPLFEGGVTQSSAEEVARIMGALATASRVRILARLKSEPSAVGDLAELLEMEQPAVSHQLRILRDLGFVAGTRTGRNVIYRLFDSHVAALLDEALRHIDHLSGNDDRHGRAGSETQSIVNP
jgi:DNA-binding transcriptional ArsR family regulator